MAKRKDSKNKAIDPDYAIGLLESNARLRSRVSILSAEKQLLKTE